jgi:hypothetical protein
VLIEDQEEEEKESDNFNEYDNNDAYGNSGEEYGWYNGFSDDAINDAF